MVNHSTNINNHLSP